MSKPTRTSRYLYRFGQTIADGDGTMTQELGGKGAALQAMARLGLPVPPGFTLQSELCRVFLKEGRLPSQVKDEVSEALHWLEERQGQIFGSKDNPLLVSVRSGAAVSMPGMMDTILNVGLNEGNLHALAERHGSLAFALDTYRRLLSMFGSVVLGVPKAKFDAAQQAVQKNAAAGGDPGLRENKLKKIVAEFQRLIQEHTGKAFPSDSRTQLDMAIDAVFQSWNNERAQHYRRIHHLSEDAGTAVTIQSMVFGNRGETSGTGVGFTRNPSTGERAIFGEFLANAQGEDIVAGTHTPMPIAELARTMPEVYRELEALTNRLEKRFHDVQDFEFTVEEGKLYLLQTRSAKRSAQAVIRSVVEMAEEGLITKTEAIRRVRPAHVHEMLLPQLDKAGLPAEGIAKGLAASPGSAVGQLTFTADRAVELAGKRHEHPVILVREETSADDIHGMDAAVGFVTAHGGATSHAAVVARGMGKCCITGVSGLEIDEERGLLRAGSCELKEGDWISIDGATGRIFAGKLPLIPGQANDPWLEKLLAWSRNLIGPAVRANADTPADAFSARKGGASGIGLCRTEHMFFAPERLPHVRAMILADTREARMPALEALLPMQQSDFEELFRAMAGLPVIIRLIDPPLHEFLPDAREVETSLAEARAQGSAQVNELEHLLARIGQLTEKNPMMGLRGCRLGITYPEIITMQTRAILRAAIRVEAEGTAVEPEIMIPLIATVAEIRFLRKVIAEAADQIFAEEHHTIAYRVGTMIELPRAAVCAASIAREVDFFSFGTNDLTQMTFGFSRDDAQKYLDAYLELGILADDPFVTIDQEGVGELIAMAISRARQANPRIGIGVCGEHGGDPRSIEFFHSLNVDYVSTSPARIPVAQLAMAQAHLKAESRMKPHLLTTHAAPEEGAAPSQAIAAGTL